MYEPVDDAENYANYNYCTSNFGDILSWGDELNTEISNATTIHSARYSIFHAETTVARHHSNSSLCFPINFRGLHSGLCLIRYAIRWSILSENKRRCAMEMSIKLKVSMFRTGIYPESRIDCALPVEHWFSPRSTRRQHVFD